MKKYSAIVIFLILAFWLGRTRAQTAQAYTMSSSAVHTTCLAPAANAYYLCVASDGVWVSNNGAAYFQVTAPTAPVASVTSWNGLTGAVTYTPPAAPVTSVNGKTGAVSIAATTTSTTTLQ